MQTHKMPHKAIILAAGLGKRMMPLTAKKPKPLIEVGGVPLIDRTLANLNNTSIETAVINVHYMADMMEAHLHKKPSNLNIKISDERDNLLNTGGGIAKALPLLGDDPFFSINSDAIWTDRDQDEDALKNLAKNYHGEDEVHLLIIKTKEAFGYFGQGYFGKGDFYLNDNKSLEWRRGRDFAPYMFGGIALMSRKLFTGREIKPFSSLEILKDAQSKGKLFGHVHRGRWYHAGCPQAVKDIDILLQIHGDNYPKEGG